jgi:pyrimidine-nucleoside phosphorylase
MKTYDDAKKLAESLAGTAREMGKQAIALITNMNEPLGNTVGNFLEIEESMDVLEGHGPEDVTELTLALGAWMTVLGGVASGYAEGIDQCRDAVASGKALKLFLENVESQGGDVSKLLADRGKRRSPHHAEFRATETGYITGIDAFSTGLAGVHLGVGRNRTDEAVCPEAGILLRHRRGDRVEKGTVIMDLYGRDEAGLGSAAALLEKAVRYGNRAPEAEPLILGEVTEL